MGGFGSGNHSARYCCVEDSRVLSLSVLRRWGKLNGVPTGWGAYSWTRGNEPAGSIHFRIDGEIPNQLLVLRYSVRSRPGEQWRPISETFPLVVTRPNFGGRRYWVRCHCGRCVTKLYGAPNSDFYLCRRCARLVYTAQRESRPDRLMRAARKLRLRCGGDSGFRKPKGMHWDTFTRISHRADELDNMAFALVLSRFRRR